MSFFKKFVLYQLKRTPEPYNGYLIVDKNVNHALLLFQHSVSVVASSDVKFYKRQFHYFNETFALLGVYDHYIGVNCVSYLVVVTEVEIVGQFKEHDLIKIKEVEFLPLFKDTVLSELPSEVVNLKKLLSLGTFYYAQCKGFNKVEINITQTVNNFNTPDNVNSFLWNRKMMLFFLRRKISVDNWISRVMCGSVQFRRIRTQQHLYYLLISRLSNERVGTRFKSRGINDYGYVANFVETEQIVIDEDTTLSVVILRGTIPLFWNQRGIQVGSHRIQYPRSIQSTMPSFQRHFSQLFKTYGNIYIINLVSEKQDELIISRKYQSCINLWNSFNNTQKIKFKHIDFHAQVKKFNFENAMRQLYMDHLHSFTDNHIVLMKGTFCLNKQRSTFRVNCIDCLDRTNALQAYICTQYLIKMLNMINRVKDLREFQLALNDCWTLNGNAISTIYTGTGALNSNHKAIDAMRSTTRAINNNFGMDEGKNESFDLMVNGFSPKTDIGEKMSSLLPRSLRNLPLNVAQTLISRRKEYIVNKAIRVSFTTWNVNSIKESRIDSDCLNALLNDMALYLSIKHPDKISPAMDLSKEIDICAIGVQEVVDLNASNIVYSGSVQANKWKDVLLRVLNANGQRKFRLLHSLQLVGVVLYIFVKADLVPYVRYVSSDSTKTGFRGTVGNKGSVAIRFNLFGNSFCFINSHFTAGQSEFKERNADFYTALTKLTFPCSRSILCSDFLFWCGDMNYRINSNNKIVKSCIKSNKLNTLLRLDQLNVNKLNGSVFGGFKEGGITFNPTYKFDVNTNVYDTSDKNRIPSWCDRILYKYRNYPDKHNKENAIKLLYYSSSPDIVCSDHKPVTAAFEVLVDIPDNNKLKEIYKNTIIDSGPYDCSIIVYNETKESMNQQNLLLFFKHWGGITYMRGTRENVIITFDNSISALNALSFNNIKFNNIILKVELFCHSYHDIYNEEWVDEEVYNTIKDSKDRTSSDEMNEDIDYNQDSYNDSDSSSEPDLLYTSEEKGRGVRPPPPIIDLLADNSIKNSSTDSNAEYSKTNLTFDLLGSSEKKSSESGNIENILFSTNSYSSSTNITSLNSADYNCPIKPNRTIKSDSTLSMGIDPKQKYPNEFHLNLSFNDEIAQPDTKNKN